MSVPQCTLIGCHDMLIPLKKVVRLETKANAIYRVRRIQTLNCIESQSAPAQEVNAVI